MGSTSEMWNSGYRLCFVFVVCVEGVVIRCMSVDMGYFRASRPIGFMS